MQQQKAWWKRALLALGSIALTMLMILGLSSFGSFLQTCAQIPESVLRLHILANSDSAADQAVKLAVRDAILAESGSLFSGANSKAEAIAQVQQNRGALEEIARKTLRASGESDDVLASVERVYFETRTYGNVTLPAGYYDALQIKIGQAQGKNWWCVLFPSLCLPAAESVPMEQVLSREEQAVVTTDGYDIRFRLVEWYQWLFGADCVPEKGTAEDRQSIASVLY